MARVSVPVADLRREPVKAAPASEHDPLEESQLLYGEQVRVFEEKAGWRRVEAKEQAEWTHHQRWEGYPGWVESGALIPEPHDWKPNLVVTAKSGKVREKPAPDAPVQMTLSLGSRIVAERIPAVQGWWKVRLLDGASGWIQAEEAWKLEALHWVSNYPTDLRTRLTQTARLFLGDPYYWGGRSAHNPQIPSPPFTAVDCSGLVGLVYQANGLAVPRDAHEQWMKARPIPRGKLSPGDLVFLSDPGHPERISHVMLYAGEGKVIEGPGTGKRVREIPLEERLRQEPGRRVLFGRYLSDG